jgi:hypothetical protein
MVLPEDGWFERLLEDGVPDHVLDAVIEFFQKRMRKSA